jgi:hypothetical protein
MVHKISTLLFIGSLLSFGSLNGQTSGAYGHGLMLEAAGASPYYSVNYFLRFFSTDYIDGYLRAGVGIWSDNYALPVGMYLQMGKNTHQGRLTMAATPHLTTYRNGEHDGSDAKLDLSIGLEYVYQFPSERLLITAGAFPYIRLDPGPNLILDSSEFGYRPGFSLSWRL